MKKSYTNIFRPIVLHLLSCVFLAGVSNAQNIVSGSVVDLSGYPLMGASIISQGDTVQTDGTGAFSIADSESITINLSGYRTQTLYPPFKSESVVLEKDPLNQSIDVAFGKQNSRGLTSAISSIRTEELSTSYLTNVGSTLYGKLAGLTVTNTTGEPGKDNPAFLIRGLGTGDATPLVYVDGLESPIEFLKLEEIETISVLKDAAALAPFGMKGANGVIWITSKRGKKGAPQIKTSIQTGIQQPTKLPKFAGSYDYARLYNEARSNDNGNVWTPFYTDEQLNGYKNATNGDLLYPNVNWYDEVLKSSAPLSNADLSVKGGDDNILYYLLLGYQSTGGLYSDTDSKRSVNSNNDYNKLNLRANIDIKLPSIFDAKITFATVVSNRFTPSYSTDALWQNMASYPANSFPVNTPLGWGGSTIYPDNPKATVIQRGFNQYHDRNVRGSMTLGEDLSFIAKGLRLTETFSLANFAGSTYIKDRDYQRFQPFAESPDVIGYVTTGSEVKDFKISETGVSLNESDFRQNIQINLSYDRLFKAHHIQGFILYNDDQYVTEGPIPSYYFRGFSGRLNYGFKEKYFAEFGYAFNGTSDFEKGKNLGFFPSVSLAWLVSEDFFKDSQSVNYLKVRASTGLVGMNNTAGQLFAYQQYYQSGTGTQRFNTNGTTTAGTLYESTLANTSLTWEKSFKSDVGIEARLFNKLDVVVDLFYERREQVLVNQNNLASLGFLNGLANDGIITNKGIELNLNWSDKIGDLAFYVNPIFSFTRNKIVQMNERPQAEDYLRRTGHPIGQPFGLVASGLFQSMDEINDPNTPTQTFAEVQPGDIRYVDQNNDGVIDNNDVTALKGKYSTVPEITYGLNIGFIFRDFDLNISSYGVAHRSVYVDDVYSYALRNNGNASVDALNRWAYYPDQGIDTRATATYPRLSLGSNSNNFRSSSFWIRNGNYFRVGQISLGYTLPHSLTMRVNIPKVKIFVLGSNLLTMDKIDSVDPETMTSYPLMKSYNLGLKMNF